MFSWPCSDRLFQWPCAPLRFNCDTLYWLTTPTHQPSSNIAKSNTNINISSLTVTSSAGNVSDPIRPHRVMAAAIVGIEISHWRGGGGWLYGSCKFYHQAATKCVHLEYLYILCYLAKAQLEVPHYRHLGTGRVWIECSPSLLWWTFSVPTNCSCFVHVALCWVCLGSHSIGLWCKSDVPVWHVGIFQVAIFYDLLPLSAPFLFWRKSSISRIDGA